jgi:hypothetical protein
MAKQLAWQLQRAQALALLARFLFSALQLALIVRLAKHLRQEVQVALLVNIAQLPLT